MTKFCQHKGCTKQANFNFEGKLPMFCKNMPKKEWKMLTAEDADTKDAKLFLVTIMNPKMNHFSV